MRKFIAIMLTLGLAVAMAGCGDGEKPKETTDPTTPGNNGKTPNVETVKHDDAFGGYCISLPKGWDFDPNDPGLDLLSAKATKGKGIIEVEITRADGKNLDSFFKGEIEKISPSKFEKKDGKLDGLDAKCCMVTFTENDKEMAGKFWAAIKDDHLYRLRLTCPADELAEFGKDFDIAVDSFHIENDPDFLDETGAGDVEEKPAEVEKPIPHPHKPATTTEPPFEIPEMITQQFEVGDGIVTFEMLVPNNWKVIAGNANDGYVFRMFSPKDKENDTANCYIYVVPREEITTMKDLIPEAKSQLDEIKTKFKYIKGETLQGDHHEYHVIYASEEVNGVTYLSVGGLYLGEHYIYYAEMIYTEKNFPALKETFEKMARSFKLTKEGQLQGTGEDEEQGNDEEE